VEVVGLGALLVTPNLTRRACREEDAIGHHAQIMSGLKKSADRHASWVTPKAARGYLGLMR
jgi:hypothetical protein